MMRVLQVWIPLTEIGGSLCGHGERETAFLGYELVKSPSTVSDGMRQKRIDGRTSEDHLISS